MQDFDIPLIDEENPLYCPSIPAVSFLDSIRRQLHDGSFASRENTPELEPDQEDSWLLPSFVRLLDKSVTDDDLLELVSDPGQYESLLNDDSGDTSLDSVLQTATFRGLTVPRLPLRLSRDLVVKQEESSPSFTGLRGPAKREISSVSVNEGSFELSGKADPFQIYARGSSPSEAMLGRRFPVASQRGNSWRTKAFELQEKVATLQGELYGISVGTETPRGMRSLISRLDNLLPGIRLADVLSKAMSHQDLVDILCSNGFMNARVLDAFRTSEIEFLDLSACLADEDGLNLDSRDVLQVLAKPHSFLFLSEINLCGAKLRDSDIMHLHHLPRLARLWLQDAGLTNEAIFLLLPLKRCLQELDIAYNPQVDDDAIIAFEMCSRLVFLKLLDTGITIKGIRRLMTFLRRRGHALQLEVPASCEEHLRQLHLKYILHPEPPLITDPNAVQSLAPAAVLHNMKAHAAVNPDVPTIGSPTFLASQLEQLLEDRKSDLFARELIGLD